jgi:hypothetical protein
MTARRASRPEPAASPAKLPAYKLRDVAELVPYANNARQHSPAQIEMLAKLITEYRWTNPVLIDGKGGIIAGHGRVLAAQKLGMTQVPTIELRHLTERQKRAYILADNQSALTASWDRDILASELLDLRLDGFDLSLTGFDALELDGLLGPAAGLTDPDDAPPVQAEAVSRLGDTWHLGRHRLTCGDCTDAAVVAAAMAGSVAAMLVTSPPYWAKQAYDDTPGIVGAAAFCSRVAEAWAGQVRRRIIINTGDTAETLIDPNGRPGVRVMLDAMWVAAFGGPGWVLRHRRVWVKGGPMIHNPPASDAVDQSCESMLTFSRPGMNEGGQERLGEPWCAMAYFTDIAGVGENVVGEDHPCPYPVEIPSRFIRLYSKSGDVVADPFCGSGTTIIAAEQSGRVCHAIEQHPQYVDVAVRRWEAFTGQTATLADDGRAFSAIAAERTRRAA